MGVSETLAIVTDFIQNIGPIFVPLIYVVSFFLWMTIEVFQFGCDAALALACGFDFDLARRFEYSNTGTAMQYSIPVPLPKSGVGIGIGIGVDNIPTRVGTSFRT